MIRGTLYTSTIMPAKERKRKGASPETKPLLFRFLSRLLRRLDQDSHRGDGEGAGCDHFSVEIVVGEVAGAAIRLSLIVHFRDLPDLGFARRVAAWVVGKVQIGEQERPFPG
jgi:hypothetical protein